MKNIVANDKNFNELFYFFCSIQHLIEKLSKTRIYLYDNNTFFFIIPFVRIFSLLFLFITKTLVNNILLRVLIIIVSFFFSLMK